MNIGSLFSGIGGLELGLENAGLGPTLWHVEKDRFCQTVLAKRWPHSAKFLNIRDIEELPYVDIICGGFPCQDLSDANTRSKRKGLDGEKSGLWKEYARVVGRVRPKYVVVENVSVLQKRGLGIVLRDLAELGYDGIWSDLPSCAVGAPHSRKRMFIVAYPHSNSKPYGAIHAAISRLQADAKRVRWPPRPERLGVAHGIPHRVDRLRSLGNAVVPQVAEIVGRLITTLEGIGNGRP